MKTNRFIKLVMILISTLLALIACSGRAETPTITFAPYTPSEEEPGLVLYAPAIATVVPRPPNAMIHVPSASCTAQEDWNYRIEKNVANSLTQFGIGRLESKKDLYFVSTYVKVAVFYQLVTPGKEYVIPVRISLTDGTFFAKTFEVKVCPDGSGGWLKELSSP